MGALTSAQARFNAQNAGRKGRKKLDLMPMQIARGPNSPVRVMFENMMYHDAEAKKLTEQLMDMGTIDFTDADDRKQFIKLMTMMYEARNRSQDCARDLAPYCHARYANITVAPKDEEDDSGSAAIQCIERVLVRAVKAEEKTHDRAA